MLPRLLFIVPLLLALAGFILSLLTLLAGYKPGFMLETHIVMLDTSRLGRDLVSSRSVLAELARRQMPNPIGDKIDEAKDKLKDKTDEAKDKVKGKAGDVIGDIIGGVTTALGVDKFYALHAMTVCSGNYTNGNDSSGGLNDRRCTAPLQDLDIVGVIDLDLKVPGAIRNDLEDLDQHLPKIFQAIAGVFIAAAALAGTSVLGAVAAALLPAKARSVGLANLAIASLAAVALLVGSLMTTIGADKVVDLVRQKASRIGLRAEVGTRFRALSWAAFALMTAAAIYWLCASFAPFRRRRGQAAWDKSGSSSRGGSYEMGNRPRHFGGRRS